MAEIKLFFTRYSLRFASVLVPVDPRLTLEANLCATQEPLSAVKRHCMFGVFLFLLQPSPPPSLSKLPFLRKVLPSLNEMGEAQKSRKTDGKCISLSVKFSTAAIVRGNKGINANWLERVWLEAIGWEIPREAEQSASCLLAGTPTRKRKRQRELYQLWRRFDVDGGWRELVSSLFH